MRIGFITPPTDPDVSYCIPVLLILTNITYMNFQQAAAVLVWHFQSSVSIATFCSLSFFYFFFIFLTTSIKIAIILLYFLHKASFCLFLFNTVSFLTQIEKACFYTIVHWSFFFLKINILSRKSYLCSLFLAREEDLVTDNLKLDGYQPSRKISTHLLEQSPPCLKTTMASKSV